MSEEQKENQPTPETTEPEKQTTPETPETNAPSTAPSDQSNQFSEPVGLLEAFKLRHSVRTFQSKPFPQQKKQMIAQIITEANSLDTPFNSHGVEISVTGPGLGRLGVISNEAGYIVEKIPLNQEEQPENPQEGQPEKPKAAPNVITRKTIIDVSFKLQNAVMKMTEHHIGTVWLGGTYNEGVAEERFPGFKIPAVVAFGEEEQNPHFIAKVFKFFGGSNKRLNYQQLFYDSDNKREITEADFDNDKKPEGCPEYPAYMNDFLTALRSGPSAMNQQTWRFVFAGKEVHLFDVKENNYSWFNSGIALSNLHLLGEIRGGSCTIEVKDPAPEPSPLGGTYVVTAVYTE